MKIIGPDDLVFGVDDIDACRTYLRDFGLNERVLADGGHRFAAQDGTALTLHLTDDPGLPPALPTATRLRRTVWGCEDQASVDEIANELGRDREVARLPDGSIATVDDVGFQIAFQVTQRNSDAMIAERVNSPGAPPARPANHIGADDAMDALPRTLSHVVYFVPDVPKMEAFYMDRLKFVETDRFSNLGPFLRPQASDDHHCLFMIQTPPHMQGLEHVAFHMQGPTALLLAGSRMAAKGYESFWGPGRHKLGSNWFWYFNSPMGAHLEYDADMDKHDDEWTPRAIEAGAETSQMFLFETVEKWSPGGGPPKH